MRSSLALLLALAACAQSTGPHCAGIFSSDVTLAGHAFPDIEVADQLDEQRFGLMGRAELADDAGMLFHWEDVAERSFYMKDTLIPLDLIAIAEGEVVGVASMVPCEQTPCVTTKTAPASDVVEINGGLAKELGIVVGDPVELNFKDCG